MGDEIWGYISSPLGVVVVGPSLSTLGLNVVFEYVLVPQLQALKFCNGVIDFLRIILEEKFDFRAIYYSLWCIFTNGYSQNLFSYLTTLTIFMTLT